MAPLGHLREGVAVLGSEDSFPTKHLLSTYFVPDNDPVSEVTFCSFYCLEN